MHVPMCALGLCRYLYVVRVTRSTYYIVVDLQTYSVPGLYQTQKKKEVKCVHRVSQFLAWVRLLCV
jgi:hypothetical protein